jgi:hypothetical protein
MQFGIEWSASTARGLVWLMTCITVFALVCCDEQDLAGRILAAGAGIAGALGVVTRDG